jgi:hypothetical protein
MNIMEFIKEVMSFDNKKNFLQAILFYLVCLFIGCLAQGFVLLCLLIGMKLHLFASDNKFWKMFYGCFIIFLQFIYPSVLLFLIIVKKQLYKTYMPYVVAFITFNLFIFGFGVALIVPTVFSFFANCSDLKIDLTKRF